MRPKQEGRVTNMRKNQTEATKKRRSPRPRCLKGQRHRWIMGAALRASDGGHLASDNDGKGGRPNHLRGQCRKCGKVRHFHPFAAQSRRTFGAMVGKRRAA